MTRMICMECGKHFNLPKHGEPVCPAPRCKSSDVEIDYQRYFTTDLIRHVKRAALMIPLALTVVGCTTPTEPTALAEAYTPQHHNIPATMEDGTVWWVCETKPRTYLRQVRDGWIRTTAPDHYIQKAQCPSTPID